MNNQQTEYKFPSDDLYDQLFADGLTDAEGDSNQGHEPRWNAVAITSSNVKADIHVSLSKLVSREM